jgi:hypothetical protein
MPLPSIPRISRETCRLWQTSCAFLYGKAHTQSWTGDPNSAGPPHWQAFGATPNRGIELGAQVKPGTLPATDRLDALKKDGFNSMFLRA